MSWLDLGLVTFIGVHALMGLGAGFLRGMLGLLGAAAAVAIAVVAAPAAAHHLPGWVPWREAMAGWGTLVAAWLIVPRLAVLLAPRREGGPKGADRWLGWLPGLAWGLLGAGCFLWLYQAFAGTLPPDAPVARALYDAMAPILQAAAAALPGTMPTPVPTLGPTPLPG